MGHKTPILSKNEVQQSHIEKWDYEFNNSGDIFDMANYIAAMEKYLNHIKAKQYPIDCVSIGIQHPTVQEGYLESARRDWPNKDHPFIH